MKEAFPQLFPDEYRGLSEENIALEAHVTRLRMTGEIILFADGPKHKDKDDTLEGGIDFLCSSGGHPGPENDERLSLKISVLSGWKRDSFIQCLEIYATPESVYKIWKERVGTPAAGTIEERIYHNFERKMDLFSAALDSDTDICEINMNEGIVP